MGLRSEINTRIVRFRNYREPQFTEMALAIRHEVFVKGQNVDPAIEYEHEEESRHYLLFIDEKPAATARWRETESGIKLERFATLEEYRNRGFGAALLKEILNDIIPLNKKIYLHSQLTAVKFYERYGFVKEGDIFYEANIGHYKMTRPDHP
ncbi:MAG: GNAT family N-acetyltransferase [Bacteroidales bacterium]